MPTLDIYKMPQVIQASKTGLGSHSVVNRTDFNLFRGVNNDIDFIIKDADRRLENITGQNNRIVFINVELGKILLEKPLQVINGNRGHCRVNITPDEMCDLSLGYVRYSILTEYDRLIFTDQTYSYRGWVEVFDGPFPDPLPPQILTDIDFVDARWGRPLERFKVSCPIKGNGQIDERSKLTSILFNLEEFDEEIVIQGALVNNVPEEIDWFDIEKHKVEEKKGTFYTSFQGTYMWLRFYYKYSHTNHKQKITKVTVKI